MKAHLHYHSKVTLVHQTGHGVAIAELKVWEVGKSSEYPAGLKFSLFLVDPNNRRIILGIDNHKPKGPHFHADDQEKPYAFRTVESLIDDFWKLVAAKGYAP